VSCFWTVASFEAWTGFISRHSAINVIIRLFQPSKSMGWLSALTWTVVRRQRWYGSIRGAQLESLREALLKSVSRLVSHSDKGKQLTQSAFKQSEGPRPRRVIDLFFGRDQGMAFFLAFLVLTTIVVPMVTLSQIGGIALGLIFALTIIFGATATIQHKSVKYFVVALTMLTLVAELISEAVPSPGASLLATALKLACLAILVFMTLKRTLRPGPVTMYRVMGGIAGYLLIGATWAFAYELVAQQAPGAIHFDAPRAQTPPWQVNDLIYFSFITLTTVGYGDVHPVHPVVRSLAVAEALIGQLYVAILIASLVGMALQDKSGHIIGE
jgi:hypothetical protein